jgi:hypothetical protein
VRAFNVHDAEESRVGTLRARQVDYFQFNFLWHFVRQQNFILRWFYARTLLRVVNVFVPNAVRREMGKSKRVKRLEISFDAVQASAPRAPFH